MPKWVYPLAFAFVIFLIYSDGAAAGDTAGNFASFIVQLLSSIGQFLTGLFEGAGSAGSSVGSNPPVIPRGSGGTTTTLLDSFTHTHDGITHSHPITGN
ncbi:MAG: hypothetical protein WBM50_13720 [Acidimicrobiales bacterium]